MSKSTERQYIEIPTDFAAGYYRRNGHNYTVLTNPKRANRRELKYLVSERTRVTVAHAPAGEPIKIWGYQVREQRDIPEILAAPEEAGKDFARETGRCYICGRLLTDPVSVSRGIGPDCHQNIQRNKEALREFGAAVVMAEIEKELAQV